MIKYEADDALAMLRPGDDHLVNVSTARSYKLFTHKSPVSWRLNICLPQTTIPVVCIMVLIIFTVLLCAKYQSFSSPSKTKRNITQTLLSRNDSIVCKICASKEA